MQGRIWLRVKGYLELLVMVLGSGIIFREWIPWGQNSLFWPFWVSLCVIFFLVVYILDVLYDLRDVREELKRIKKRKTREKTRRKTT